MVCYCICIIIKYYVEGMEDMKIKKSLSKIINNDEMELKYFYRVTEKDMLKCKVFGIEVERQDFENGEIVGLERDSVKVVAHDEGKVNEILMMLCDNIVSPLHLVDIIG